MIDLGSVGGAGVQLRDAIREEDPWAAHHRGRFLDRVEGRGLRIREGDRLHAGRGHGRARADLAAGADLLKVCVTGWPADAVAAPDSVEFAAPLLDPVLSVARRAKAPVYAHAIGQAGALLAAGRGACAPSRAPRSSIPQRPGPSRART
ncbi:MAG: hypothetical protein U0133_01300 [Gemmatimonadales bacterium]